MSPRVMAQRPQTRHDPAPHEARHRDPHHRDTPHRAPLRRMAFELPARTESVSRARHLTEERLILWGCGPEIRDTAALVVSELVTNAVLHTASSRIVCEVREGAEALRIAVRDEGGPAGPRIRDCGADERGRGLLIVDALCAAWGAERTGHGTAQIVWAELPLALGEPC
ncbi:ATP-binding protein [Streptomyces sp. NRRL F-5727]|uniref:ATP-binding protein n=1 Tax=Streptomyces sp. NRRL F-5727 TaxID=1463871 RepID=UPI001F342925|nr:ATP-binding protein [Streptomyces sp. NRRL F-5727]